MVPRRFSSFLSYRLEGKKVRTAKHSQQRILIPSSRTSKDEGTTRKDQKRNEREMFPHFESIQIFVEWQLETQKLIL